MNLTQTNAQAMREELINGIAELSDAALNALYEFFRFEKSGKPAVPKKVGAFQSRAAFEKWIDAIYAPDLEIERDNSLPRPVTYFDDWRDEK
jgi:hypothetical protein